MYAVSVMLVSYFAVQVKQTVFSAGYMADVDLDHGTTLNKKIRNAQLAQYNFIFGKRYLVFAHKTDTLLRSRLILFFSFAPTKG